MKMTQAYPRLLESLGELRRRWRTRQVLEGVLLAFAAFAGALAALVIVDNLWRPREPVARFGLALLLWATAAYALFGLVLRRWLEDRREDFFAALVERKHPELRNQLINALQLGRGTANGFSPRLVEAIVNDAAAATADLEMHDSLDARQARRAGLCALAAAAVLAGYAFFLTPLFANGVARVLLPGADIPPYSATRVVEESVRPGDAKVPEGHSFVIRARVEGVIPPSARLVVRPDGGPEQPHDMDADGDTFRHRVRQAGTSFAYFIQAGDGRSRTYHVEVVKRPRVEELTLTYARPAYTGQGPRTVAKADGEVNDIPGTVVTVRVTASKPLGEAALVTGRRAGYEITDQTLDALKKQEVPGPVVGVLERLKGQIFPTKKDFQAELGKALPAGVLERYQAAAMRHARKSDEEKRIALHRAGSDRVWQASFVLTTEDVRAVPENAEVIEAPNRYQIRLKAADGWDNLQPVWHPVTAARDYEPAVVITSPEPAQQLAPGKNNRLGPVAVAVETRDDFGVGSVGLEYRVQKGSQRYDKDLAFVPLRSPGPVVHPGPPDRPPRLLTQDVFRWDVSGLNLRPGDRLEYRARATDRNTVTGPGEARSGWNTLTVALTAEQFRDRVEEQIPNFIEALEELLRLQQENHAATRSARQPTDFSPRVSDQVAIRNRTLRLARALEESAVPLATVVAALDGLYRGPMAEAVARLESARDAADPDRRDRRRGAALEAQEKIIRELKALLLRLQTNDRARQALRKLKKDNPASHKKITEQLTKMIRGLDELLKDETKMMEKFQRMPKKTSDAVKEERMKLSREMEEVQKKWEKWAKGTIEELAKLPTGFVDDFKLRKDVNSVYEEIEKAASRSKAEKLEVSLEDLGAGLATKMKEDLETWMPDAPDATKWVLEEPLNKKTPKVPEMPLPKALEDLVGDLLQKAEEFDEEADDVTSAWGDNLDQAGWGVSDGPISSFSAKGKTGNDLPNANEVSGRSGDGRRGKSSGQMVGDTARNLKGRKTPARVNNERYEPGQLKQESNADPQGATGGGKKAGAGRKGLQGGTPPDVVKDIGRLGAKQAGLREKAEQVAKKLSAAGIQSGRLDRSITLFKQSEKDLRGLRYRDAARKRKEALKALKGAALEIDRGVGLQMSRSRELPPEMRKELLQGADDGYPPGYEGLLKNYYKELSRAEK